MIAREEGLARASALFGVYDFKGDVAAYARHMAAWLADAPDGALLMCHPATAAASDVIGPARQRELAFLASPAWPQALALAGLRLARGGDVLA